jgi:hypothetical protein|uniref:Uncharacterized protein n=1 Tax=Sipha flava TaxID=143950 RepID=A0A2S2R438_9HEMI
MRFIFILFLSMAFIVTTAVCVDSKHLQGFTYRSRLYETIVPKDSQRKTIWSWGWSNQKNHNSDTSKVTPTTNSKNSSVSTPTPSFKEASLRTTENINNHIEISTRHLELEQTLIAPRKFKSCPNGLVRNNRNVCVDYTDSDK